jgi:hypothetical protein
MTHQKLYTTLALLALAALLSFATKEPSTFVVVATVVSALHKGQH